MRAFSDDLIFVVYLYQRWCYGVDHSRPNEYGQVGDEPNKDDANGDDQGAEPSAGQSASQSAGPMSAAHSAASATGSAGSAKKNK